MHKTKTTLIRIINKNGIVAVKILE